ncbi:MAG TPA: VanW family protein [Candidatus Absconditabacterales bacterium]|nr:VanW family protein [Candidatus Absconditabacterales bacterium]
MTTRSATSVFAQESLVGHGFGRGIISTMLLWAEETQNTLGSTTCKAQIIGSGLQMSLGCVLHRMYPVIPFEESLHLVRDHIDSIDRVYDIAQPSFEFSGSRLYSSRLERMYDIEHTIDSMSSWERVVRSMTNQTITVPLSYIAYRQLKEYGIVAADRDISLYGDCAKQNFMVGMKAMEHIILDSGGTRNANKTFAYLSGYCTGLEDGPTYMFYQGICGVSSMAYRASLLNPSIDIVKRSNHTKWYTKYYGDIIYGDDASLYEDIKQFEIRNNSDQLLIIKSKLISGKPYLVFLHPKPLPSTITLTKQQTGPLSAMIARSRIQDGELQKQQWFSNYSIKTDASN